MRGKVISSLLAMVFLAGVADARWGHHKYNHNQRYNNYNQGFHHNFHSRNTYYQQPQIANLTQEQIDGLVFMYQEEKLARDVYTTLGQIYSNDVSVFATIQRSEQRHMDAIKYLLTRYNINVPVPSDDIGVFDNEELQALYNELITKGKTSLKDALEVGVLVEETDIADLEEKIANAPSDVARIYQNLERGSYNHLRAFKNSLEVAQ